MFTGCMTNADTPPKAGVDEQPDPSNYVYEATDGLAVGKHRYASGIGGLRAINLETGERLWKHETGKESYHLLALN